MRPVASGTRKPASPGLACRANGLADGYCPEQTGQCSQPGELLAADSALRQVKLKGPAVGRSDGVEDIDPQLEAKVRAAARTGHGALPRCGTLRERITASSMKSAPEHSVGWTRRWCAFLAER